MVIVTHDLDEAALLGDEILILDQGRERDIHVPAALNFTPQSRRSGRRAAITALSRVELAAVHRAQARRTTVPAPAFLPGEGGAARGLQGEDREAAIAYSAAPTGGI